MLSIFWVLVANVFLSRQMIHAAQWNPQDQHPCTVQRLSWEALNEEFPKGIPPLHKSPIVITGNTTHNEDFRRRTERQALMATMGSDLTVKLTSSNALSELERVVPLIQYMEESFQAEETSVNQTSLDSWYLFGHTYTPPWQRLLDHYNLPPCVTCTADLVALSFGLGNRGSGVSWHVHGPGFSEALWGRKHWVLYPPAVVVAGRSSFDKDQSSRQWMETEYPTASPRPFECTLEPGDLIYFPDKWWHATINLDRYTAFVSTFTTEHHVDEIMLEL